MAQKNKIQAISFLVLLGLMILLMGMLFLPYASVLLWAAVCYILASPLYTKILRRMNKHKRLYEAKRYFLAGVFSVGTVLIMAGIFFFLGFQLIGQGRVFIERAKDFISLNPNFFSTTDAGSTIASMVKQISLGTVDISQLDIKAEFLLFLSTYTNNIMDLTRSLLKNVSVFILSLAFICFALYFFYLDATYLANLFIKAIPINPKSTRKLLTKFTDVTKHLFMGFFLVAFYQACAAFIIFSIFKVDGALLFSVMLFFCSFIPMFGCAIIWVPLGLSIILSGAAVPGIIFCILCAFFISFLDNFLRPFFLKDRVKIHPLLIFFSIIGGLKVFGFNGILIGPLIIILFFTIVDIALEEETVASLDAL